MFIILVRVPIYPCESTHIFHIDNIKVKITEININIINGQAYMSRPRENKTSSFASNSGGGINNILIAYKRLKIVKDPLEGNLAWDMKTLSGL